MNISADLNHTYLFSNYFNMKPNFLWERTLQAVGVVGLMGSLDILEYSEKWIVIVYSKYWWDVIMQINHIHLCRWNQTGGWSREAQQKVQRWAAVGSKALGDRLLCTQTLLTHITHYTNRQEVTAQHVLTGKMDIHGSSLASWCLTGKDPNLMLKITF